MKTLVHTISSNLKYVIRATTNHKTLIHQNVMYTYSNRSYEMFQGNGIGRICV